MGFVKDEAEGKVGQGSKCQPRSGDHMSEVTNCCECTGFRAATPVLPQKSPDACQKLQV